MKYYLIAGEKSGDLHGSNLMKALQEKDPDSHFRFWGGDLMQSAGGELVVHYRQLAVMGFWEVLKNILRITQFISLCKKDIINYRPDVVILIDFAGFNMRIAQFANKNGFKVFYYISPKIWAWNTSRALKIKKYVDRMFVILPFEQGFYRKYHWEVDYVGNPVVDAVDGFVPSVDFPVQVNSTGKPLIAVLPGSRKQELQHMMPTLSEVMKKLSQYHFLIAKVDSIPEYLYDSCVGISNIQLVEEKTYDILSLAKAAIVTSGTATLETALLNVPQVVVYKTGTLSYIIGKAVIKVPFVSLVNLIAEEKVVEELIQDACNGENITSELVRLVENRSRQTEIHDGYKKIRDILGNDSASNRAADLIWMYLAE